MGNWFGDLDLAAKYAMGFGILLALVATFGFIKLFLQKRKIRLIRAEMAAKAADEESGIEQVALAQRELDEGDLFGIRALEKGFYGGVAQSRPTTPSASVITLIPGNIPYGQGSRQQSQMSTTTVGGSNSGRNSATDPAVNMNQTIPDSPPFGPKDPAHSNRSSLNSKHFRTPSASPSASPSRLPSPLMEVEHPARAYVRTPLVEVTDTQPAPMQYSVSDNGTDSLSNSPGSNRNSRSTPQPHRISGSSLAPAGTRPAHRSQGSQGSIGTIYNSYYREGVNSGFDFGNAPGTAPGSDGKTPA